MKSTLLLFLLAFSATVFAQDFEENIAYTFERNEDYYLLADSVNVRKTPALKGELVTVLPIGTKVTILSESKVVTRLNNYNMYWYEVKFNGRQKGFIWGGKIAKVSFRSTRNPDIVFHFGLDFVQLVDDWEESFYQVRIAQNGKQLSKTTVKGFGHSTKSHNLVNHGSKGLTNVDDVLYLEGFGESCGDAGGSVVLMHTNGKLTEAKRLDSFFDVPVFSTDIFYFPCDMEGKRDRIVFLHEDGEWVDGETEEDPGYTRYDKRETIVYKWDGERLVETK